MEKEVSAAETYRTPRRLLRKQFFALIDQVRERTRQVPVAELEEAIAGAVETAKRGGKWYEGQPRHTN